MNTEIRAVSATVLLILGFKRAAALVEGAFAPHVMCSSGPALFCSTSCEVPALD
jgi:hypothetical protein